MHPSPCHAPAAGATILRHAPLGNIQLRQDFDARNNRRCILVVDFVDGENFPVHRMRTTDFFVGLDVDVRGLRGHGLRQDLAHPLKIGASEAMSRRCSMNSDASGWSPLASSSWDASCKYHSLNWLEISRLQPEAHPGAPVRSTSRRASRSCALPRSTDAKSGSGLSGIVVGIAKRQQVVCQKAGIQPRSLWLSLRNASWRTKGNPAWRECRIHIHFGNQAQADQ